MECLGFATNVLLHVLRSQWQWWHHISAAFLAQETVTSNVPQSVQSSVATFAGGIAATKSLTDIKSFCAWLVRVGLAMSSSVVQKFVDWIVMLFRGLHYWSTWLAAEATAAVTSSYVVATKIGAVQ